MAGESADLAVGERIAEVRRQRGLRQEDFLDLLAASELSWTRTTLSRIESGQRALKATELFIVADVLGISADKLNPESGSLPYAIQRQRARFRDASTRAQRSAWAAQRAKDGLVALLLVNELRSGKASFVVHGTPKKFVFAVKYAIDSDEQSTRAISGGVSQVSQELREKWAQVHNVIGLDTDEFEKIADRVTDRAAKRGEHPERLYEETYEELFSKHFPGMTFVGGENGPLTVEGLEVDGGG